MKKTLSLLCAVLLNLLLATFFVIGISTSLHLMSKANDFVVFCGMTLLSCTLTLGVVVLMWRGRPTYLWLRKKFVAEKKFYFSKYHTLVVIACISLSGCYKVIPPGHAGIVVQQTGSARGVNQIPVETGRVFYNPFNEDVLDYPTFVQRAIWTASANEGRKDEKGERANEEIAFQSSDSLHFTGDVAVSYQLVHEQVPHFYVQFRSDDLDTFTHGFFRDAVRKAIGLAAQGFTQEEINGGKQSDLEKNAEASLRKAMASFGVNIVQLAFTSPPRPPEQVKKAIEAKVAAIQKAEQIENEKRQSVAEGAKNIALADAQAKANMLITNSISPTLLQWEQLKVMQSRWDGKMPMVTGATAPLMLQLPH